MLSIINIMLGLQYSCAKPNSCIPTWAVDTFCKLELKSFDQGNKFRELRERFQVNEERTLFRSSRDENEKSKNPFPSEVIPHFPRLTHKVVKLFLKAMTVNEVDPFEQTTLPWSLCLHASIPARFSSSGIEITTLSPFRQGWGS